MTAHTQGDERKLRELILYISQRCANDPTFGAIKLNKTLCFSDFFFTDTSSAELPELNTRSCQTGQPPAAYFPFAVNDGLWLVGHPEVRCKADLYRSAPSISYHLIFRFSLAKKSQWWIR